MSDEDDEAYGLAEIVDLEEMPAPAYPAQPTEPDAYEPTIGLIGTGGISEQHLTAYTNAGYEVAALCNRTRSKAVDRREEFGLDDAAIYTDYEALLERDDIDVVDVTPHPENRTPILRAAIRAGKHVLSQKPFTVDVDEAEALVELADANDVKLAVNQNGRFAPHFSYLRHAVADGLIGDVHGVHCNVHWDHNWIHDTPFDDVEHIILYDFAIHWFDIVTCLVDATPRRVFANYERSPSQDATPPLLGSAIVAFDGVQATLTFDGDTTVGPEDRTVVTGAEGTLKSEGPDLEEQSVTVFTDEGYATPDLEGTWFPDGFHGAMAELLCAIEADREPTHSGRNNLATLELTFAAVASAERGEPVVPGEVRRLPGAD